MVSKDITHNFRIKIQIYKIPKHLKLQIPKGENIFSFQVWSRVSFLQISRKENVITPMLLLLLLMLLLLLLIIYFSFSFKLIKTLHIPFYLFIEYTFF